MTRAALSQVWATVSIVFASYVLSCLGGAGAFALATTLASRDMTMVSAFPAIGVFTAVVGLPGFVALRLALRWKRASSVIAFALAGGLNGIVAIFILTEARWPTGWSGLALALMIVATGMVSGVIYRWCERALLHDIRDTRQMGHGDAV